MEHGKKNRKFGRETKQRKAFIRSLLVGLIAHKKITTTEARAKSVAPAIEKLITKSRNGGVAVTRLLVSRVGRQAARVLITDIGPRFKERSGGYTRIRKLSPRTSDGAPMAIIEFIQ